MTDPLLSSVDVNKCCWNPPEEDISTCEPTAESPQRDTYQAPPRSGQSSRTEIQPSFKIPFQLRSAHCIQDTVSDIEKLVRTVQSNWERNWKDIAFDTVAPELLSSLLPQILEKGSYDIEYAAVMKPGKYVNGNLVVEGRHIMDLKLKLIDGKIKGQIDFIPPIHYEKFWIPIPLKTIFIETKAEIDPKTGKPTEKLEGKSGVFVGIPWSAKTETLTSGDISEILTGEKIGFWDIVTEKHPESLRGSLIQILGRALQNLRNDPGSIQRNGLDKMVDPLAATFRIKINPRQGDPELPPLSDVGHSRAHFDEIRLTKNLVLKDIDSEVAIEPMPEQNNGLRIKIKKSTIANIHYDPATKCGDQANPGINVQKQDVEDLVIEVVPHDSDDITKGVTLKGHGRIVTGKTNIHEDVILSAHEGDKAITFSFEGDPLKRFSLDITVPETGIEKADLSVTSPHINNVAVSASLKNSLNRDIKIHVDLVNGKEPYFKAQLSPHTESATFRVSDPQGHEMARLASQEVSCAPITVARSEKDSQNITLNVSGCQVGNSQIDANVASILRAAGFIDSGNLTWLGPLKNTASVNGLTVQGHVPLQTEIVSMPFGLDPLPIPLPTGFTLDDLSVSLPKSVVSTKINGVPVTLTNTADVHVGKTDPGGFYRVHLTATDRADVSGVTAYGKLNGSVDLTPSFQILAGGIHLRRTGEVEQRSLPLKMTDQLVVSDGPNGKLVIRQSAQILQPSPSQSSTQIVVDLSSLLKMTGSENQRFGYYSFNPESSQSLPLSLAFSTSLPNGAQLNLGGNGRVSTKDLLSPNRQVGFDLSVPVETPRIPLEGLTPGVTGWVQPTGGRLIVNGRNLQSQTQLVLPALQVDVTMVGDPATAAKDMTFHITGGLKPKSALVTSLNLKDGELVIPEKSHHLEGDLDVEIKNAQGAVIGHGALHVETDYALSGSSTLQKAKISLNIPSTLLTGSIMTDIKTTELELPKGTSIKLPIKDGGIVLDINIPELMALIKEQQGRK